MLPKRNDLATRLIVVIIQSTNQIRLGIYTNGWFSATNILWQKNFISPQCKVVAESFGNGPCHNKTLSLRKSICCWQKYF